MEELEKLIGSDVSTYTITRYISSGSFGNVFEAKNKDDDKLVALKIPIKTDDKDGLPSLLEEAKVYKHISNKEKGIAEMKVVRFNDRKVIVMDLLGASLESLLTKYKKFNMKTIISLAISMIDLMKYIHSCGFLHRDIKPDNFVLDYTNQRKIFCIDFGISKKYIKKDGKHIEFSNKTKFCGTARYASISAHKNIEQSRKDDLESIAYILIYMYKGKLPWQGIKHKDKREKYKLIGEKKESVSEEELCKSMPKEFLVFLKYVRNLDFDEKPHYSALKKMFTKLYSSKNYKNDKLEWEK